MNGMKHAQQEAEQFLAALGDRPYWAKTLSALREALIAVEDKKERNSTPRSGSGSKDWSGGMDLVASLGAGRSRRRLTKPGTSLAGTPVHRWLLVAARETRGHWRLSRRPCQKAGRATGTSLSIQTPILALNSFSFLSSTAIKASRNALSVFAQ